MCKCIAATMVIEICSSALFEIDFVCITQIYINYLMLFKYLSEDINSFYRMAYTCTMRSWESGPTEDSSTPT